MQLVDLVADRPRRLLEVGVAAVCDALALIVFFTPFGLVLADSLPDLHAEEALMPPTSLNDSVTAKLTDFPLTLALPLRLVESLGRVTRVLFVGDVGDVGAGGRSANGVKPRVATGLLTKPVTPSPKRPFAPFPQHMAAPAASMPQVWSPPEEMTPPSEAPAAPANSAITTTGQEEGKRERESLTAWTVGTHCDGGIQFDVLGDGGRESAR